MDIRAVKILVLGGGQVGANVAENLAAIDQNDVTVVDIDEEVRRRAELERRTQRDSLTDLLNKTAFREKICAAMPVSRRPSFVGARRRRAKRAGRR